MAFLDPGAFLDSFRLANHPRTSLGPVLAVRPYCNNEHYWQVYFDTNRLIRDTFAHAGFPVLPEQHYSVRGPKEFTLAKTA